MATNPNEYNRPSLTVIPNPQLEQTLESLLNWLEFSEEPLPVGWTLTRTIPFRHLHPVMRLRRDYTHRNDMAAANVKFRFSCGNAVGLKACDPQKTPVTIVGQLDHLKLLTFEQIKCKLAPRVTDEEHFKNCVESLHPAPTDSCPLYMNFATLVALSSKPVSRHNTPTRAHSLSKVIKNCTSHADYEYIVLVCPRSYVLPYVAAISRAFPIYSMKTSKSNNNTVEDGTRVSSTTTITIEIMLVNDQVEGDRGCLTSLKLDPNDLNCLSDVSIGVRSAAKIVDMPCNDMNVDRFKKEAEGVYNELKKIHGSSISMKLIEGEVLESQGFGGIYNVGKGAAGSPALIVLSYKPDSSGRNKKNIAWVGKGIVFDTGGLCIKTRASMCGMKRDCGGAAAVLYAFYVAVKQGFKDNLHAVLCMAENSVSERSMRCDDIITMYSGKTVEVNNTDAEGRLVLGDGVAYAKKDLDCSIILDMATLTGAQGIATGKYHGAVLTNDESYEPKLMAAGKTSGDLTFPIPFAPELHFSEFNSVVADMKNSVADRGNAQCSCAGLFILSHIGLEFPGTWIHVDMASPVEVGDRGTGYGVMLLNTLFGKHLDKNSLFYQIAP